METNAPIQANEKRSPLARLLKPVFLQQWAAIIKTEGLKGFVKRKGWTILIAFFLFYLIRDSLLYLLIPYLIARGLWGC